MRKHSRLVAQLQSVQQDLTSFLNEDVINQACFQTGHTWRKRVLTPFVIIHWFLQQILLQNTALKHISLLANRSFTDSAYCQARQKLPLKVFELLLANPDYAYPSELISIGCSELSSFSQFRPNANSAQSFPYPKVTFSVSV